jgi:hypothetical protein
VTTVAPKPWHTTGTNPRSLTIEAAWLPESLDELQETRRRLTEAGYSHREVAGCAGWLLAKAAGDPDMTSPESRSKYRRMLEALGEPARTNRGAR